MVYDPPVTVFKVLRNALWLGLGEAAIKGGTVIVVVLIGRELGAAAVGVFSVAYAAALVAVLLLAAGQQEVLIREVARGPDRAGLLLDASMAVQRRLGRWIAAAACLLALAVPDASLRLGLLSFVPYSVLRTLTVTAGAAFKGLDRMDVEVRARSLEMVVTISLVAAIVFLGLPVWAVGLAFSVGSAVGLAWLLRSTAELPRTGEPMAATMMLREGTAFMVLSVTGQLVNSSGRFLLVAFGVVMHEIGYLGAAGTMVWAMVTLPQLGAVAVYPSFSRLAESGASPRKAGIWAALAGIGGGLVCAVLLHTFAGPVTALAFGGGFAGAVPLLERLAFALPGAFAAMTLGAVFASWRLQRRTMVLYLVALAVGLTVNLALIPAMGVMGAVLAAVTAYTALAAMLMVALFVPAR
jgi:O-antigen/teichoic acid export membrane protein